MMKAYLIIILALVGWKGWHAWQRGRRQWTQDMVQYQSLWEYLLGNGATLKEARAKAYEATKWVSFANKYMRTDIGKAIDEV